jgi:hypothetical protein
LPNGGQFVIVNPEWVNYEKNSSEFFELKAEPPRASQYKSNNFYRAGKFSTLTIAKNAKASPHHSDEPFGGTRGRRSFLQKRISTEQIFRNFLKLFREIFCVKKI